MGNRRIVKSFTLFLVAMLGCEAENEIGRQALTGTVTFNGRFLEKGSIGFEPYQTAGVTSGAMIIDGKFEIAELRGLPPGTYLVRINSATSDEEAIANQPPGAPEPPGKELIPAEFNVRSNVTITVKTGTENEFEFTIP